MSEKVVCKKCILHSGMMGIKINDNGLCNLCTNPKENKQHISTEERHQAAREMEYIMTDLQKNSGLRKFDCVVGFSGGKDSTYLLWLLKNQYDLNPLAVSIDTGFLAEVARRNISQTISKLGVSHQWIRPQIQAMAKFYRNMMLNHDSATEPLLGAVCPRCSDLIDGLILKIALEKDIPYVFIGLSPDETYRFFFEISRKKMQQDWKPGILEGKEFDEADRKLWWNGNKIPPEKIPRVVFPYHAWPYNEVEVRKICEAESLVDTGMSDPLKTNCGLIWALGFYDINRYGYHPYRIPFAELVRSGMADRETWLKIFEQVHPLIKQGIYNKEAVDHFFNTIGITKEEVLALLLSKNQENSLDVPGPPLLQKI